jgi:hypothetical protein
VQKFLLRQPDADVLQLPDLPGLDGCVAGQILPSGISDGFYYALLKKRRA